MEPCTTTESKVAVSTTEASDVADVKIFVITTEDIDAIRAS